MVLKIKCIFCFLFYVCSFANAQYIVPIGGNTFVTNNSKNGNEKVNNSGIQNWENKNAVISTYIHMAQKGEITIAAIHESIKNNSTIKCTINNISKTIQLIATTIETTLGIWKVETPGYIKIDLQGVQKTGTSFGILHSLKIKSNSKISYVQNNDGNYFYWGRRGPSVHLNYSVDAKDSVEWFYNEVEVPKNNDVIGSFFMANGFDVGYFGMQVNSAKERRILFSVWSPFNTDDPNKIPEDKKIKLIQKGNDVYTGEFGNEGSGGQSYLKYNWKAANNYKFLLHAQPAADNFTIYTAYFYANELSKWLLIASFSRPESKPYLSRMHSFLENFEPETGYKTRKVFFQNQFIKSKNEPWKPLKEALFTADATAKIAYRLDYKGGVENGKFFLQNCGFFNDSSIIKTKFSVNTKLQFPLVDIQKISTLLN